jgi:hypothetical protein
VSYDIAVWVGSADPATVEDDYPGLLEELEAPSDQAPLPELQRFLDLLTEVGGDLQWASGDLGADAGKHVVVLSVELVDAARARQACAQLASRLGLACYDPQNGQVLSRGRPPSSTRH